jgi:hypothetical protein
MKKIIETTEPIAEYIIAALVANDVAPQATHTDARGKDWGFVAAYLADDTTYTTYAIKYGNNGATSYDMADDIDDLASWIILDDADAVAVANARREDPTVVADDYAGPCYIISKSNMYDSNVYAWVVDRETNQQDRIEFDCRAAAQEWADDAENEIYQLSQNECGRALYFIVGA